jgi:hypothetical protein
MRHKVSHTYKTAGKIMVLYNLIFMFLEEGWEDERLRMEDKRY